MLERQCIFAAFGGKVDVTGEILHGKTSPLSHDTKGLYAGLPQNLPVTRYHSLAGTHDTLPDCLEITSWIAKGPDGGKGIIMGVRHKEFLVEGVQFHPESILTAEGRKMIKNFLTMRGGTWAENAKYQAGLTNGSTASTEENPGKDSILDKIYRQRRLDVEEQKQIPSQRLEDLERAYALGLAPPQISFPDRLRQSRFTLSLLAEIKRASPSKGPIGMSIFAPAQARQYAAAGASVISVLTEPHWFKGSIDDLRMVRQALAGMPNRPAILRKEFILDEYQILEARLAGADTVLLIVKMLDDSTLRRLYHYSQSLGMEPLVEVNTSEEMQRALELGSQVIGVNNRDLTNFNVDLSTTSRLMENVPDHVIICALSGISNSSDVEAYKSHRVGGVLIGEALMKTPNIDQFVSNLLQRKGSHSAQPQRRKLLVKVCGTRTSEAAEAAIEAGADMIGIILVQGRKRTVTTETAQAISRVIHSQQKLSEAVLPEELSGNSHFQHFADVLRMSRRALLVGVFQNQSLSYILEQQQLLNLDIVQLHGSEPVEWASLIPVPVFRRFDVLDNGLTQRPYHSLPLLDGAAGGTGELLDSDSVTKRLSAEPDLQIILAGGLKPENLERTFEALHSVRDRIAAVDVSSGVETDGQQSLERIRTFVRIAKSL